MGNTVNENQDFVLDLYNKMEKDNLSYVYRGNFSTNLTDRILSLTEANLMKIGGSTKIKKRVYFIMVESLQNITRHQDELKSKSVDKSGFFIIQRIESDYFVTSGNIIENKNIDALKAKLEKVNSLDKESLKAYSKEILSEGTISEKGGAGLGLVEMARRSGNKLAFDFKHVDDNFSFFYLQTKIPTGEDSVPANDDYVGDLEAAKNFHKMILDKDIQLVYQGEFSQENIKGLLSMAEGNIGHKDELHIKKKVFNIIVEMLQNIYKYARNSEEEDKEKTGIFIIGMEGEEYVITTGNLIDNDKTEELKNRLDNINKLDFEQLNELYGEIIIRDEETSQGSNKLGLIDMKIKSRNNLTYCISHVNDEYSFYSIKVKIAELNN